jgi:hypothetical protein
VKTIVVFLANNWVWLTLPIFLIGYLLAFANFFFNWTPPLLPVSLGYWLLFFVFLFWVFAPAIFRKYKTKLV